MKPTLAFLIFAIEADSDAIISEQIDYVPPHMTHRTEALGKLIRHHNGFPP